jgi:hypothetical protein
MQAALGSAGERECRELSRCQQQQVHVAEG